MELGNNLINWFEIKIIDITPKSKQNNNKTDKHLYSLSFLAVATLISLSLVPIADTNSFSKIGFQPFFSASSLQNSVININKS